MRACGLCRALADTARCRYCDRHRADLDEVELAETRAAVERDRARLPALPPPPQLPPRKPTRFDP